MLKRLECYRRQFYRLFWKRRVGLGVDGFCVGLGVCDRVGLGVGDRVGDLVGLGVGDRVGGLVGLGVGDCVGLGVGD
jgi:hypothetical protein